MKSEKTVKKNPKVCSVSLDLAKAFDSSKQNKFLQKMDSYGLRRQAAK